MLIVSVLLYLIIQKTKAKRFKEKVKFFYLIQKVHVLHLLILHLLHCLNGEMTVILPNFHLSLLLGQGVGQKEQSTEKMEQIITSLFQFEHRYVESTIYIREGLSVQNSFEKTVLSAAKMT